MSSQQNGIAALLSLVIPGAGQIYKGHVGAGLLWLFAVIAGYVLFILPGLLLHVLCILNAASGGPSSVPAYVQTPEQKAAQAQAHRWLFRGLLVLIAGCALLMVLLNWLAPYVSEY